MKPFDYFKKTFVFVFIFIFVFKLVSQMLDGISTITGKFFIKIILVAFTTALTLAVLYYFFKIGFTEKKNN